MSLKTDDFKLPLIEEAHRLVDSARRHSTTSDLDEKTTMWVIRREAWIEFMRSQGFLICVQTSPKRNELLGMPVRITIDDEPDVPMIQLVMEPKVFAR